MTDQGARRCRRCLLNCWPGRHYAARPRCRRGNGGRVRPGDVETCWSHLTPDGRWYNRTKPACVGSGIRTEPPWGEAGWGSLMAVFSGRPWGKYQACRHSAPPGTAPGGSAAVGSRQGLFWFRVMSPERVLRRSFGATGAGGCPGQPDRLQRVNCSVQGGHPEGNPEEMLPHACQPGRLEGIQRETIAG